MPSGVVCRYMQLFVIDKDLVDQFADSLCDQYKDTGFFSEEAEWPPNQPKGVVNVVTMSHEGKRTQQELMEVVK